MRVSRLLCVCPKACPALVAQLSNATIPEAQARPRSLEPPTGCRHTGPPRQNAGALQPSLSEKAHCGYLSTSALWAQTPWSEPHLQGPSQHPQRA